jgi:hypothetical protein
MAKEVTLSQKIWSNLISYIVSTQESYIKYTEDEISWLTSKLVALFTNKVEDLSPDAVYKCLVYLNRDKKYGRYSLIFNMKVSEAVFSLNDVALVEICRNPSFPELESLKKPEQDEWNNNIFIEMLCYNLYTDRELLSAGNGSIPIEKKLCFCYEEVLSYRTGIAAKYISCPTKHIVLLSEHNEDGIMVWPIKEIDLIFLILSKGNNPYTGVPLPTRIRNIIKIKYAHILQICFKAYNLGYHHEYDL